MDRDVYGDAYGYGDAPLPAPLPPPLAPPPPAPVAPDSREPKYKTPQRQLTEFWDGYHHKAPGKVTTILPRGLYKSLIRSHHGTCDHIVRNAAASYEIAAEACRAKVASIVKHCEMTNEKFTDPDFDVYKNPFDCLHSLMTLYPWWEDMSDEEDDGDIWFFGKPEAREGEKAAEEPQNQQAQEERQLQKRPKRVEAKRMKKNANVPQTRATSGPAESKGYRAGELIYFGSIHRIDWIFEKPQFTVDGFSASDIRQGQLGNCWWLAAVATIAHRTDLMEKVMVARNEECGVYGFVFHRDGEWIYTVIDDNLFLTHSDFTASRDRYDPTGKLAREHKKTKQTGSRALILASCEDENETWLPLLEKAYAKVHNDYTSLSGGWPGEGVEDMTGGVNSYLISSRVLYKDRLWQELINEKGEFVFSLGLMPTGRENARGGMATGHAYSLLKAVEAEDQEGKKMRLVKIRNPWGARDSFGFGEWNGPWSDGSSEWNPYWMEKLGHKFGDDGVFWMTYEDMLSHYEEINRTRLFNSEWTVAQQWTSVNVPWVTGYLQKKFVIEVKNGGLCVVVLSQLDERYWTGLEGEYRFELYFLLIKEGGSEQDLVSRARCNTSWDSRSINCEVDLAAGKYIVLPKVVAEKRWCGYDIVNVVTKMTDANPEKMRQVGMQYDISHARPGVQDEDEKLEEEFAKKKKKKEDKKKRDKKAKEKRKAIKIKDKAQREKDEAKMKRKIEKDNENRAKQRVRREKRLQVKALQRAKKEAQREKRRLKKEKQRLEKEKAKEEAAAEAAKKESPPESEKDAVLVKKEDVEEEAKATAQPPTETTDTSKEKPETTEAAPKAEGSATEDKTDEPEKGEAAPDVPAKTEEQSSVEKPEEEPVKSKPEAEDAGSGTDLGELAEEKKETMAGDETKKEEVAEKKKETEKEKKVEQEAGQGSESESDSDEDDFPYLSEETEPEVASDEEYIPPDSEIESSESDSEDDNILEETIPQGWNPVVVLGLRVYSKDKEVTVKVEEPKDPEENASIGLATEASFTGSLAPL